MKLKNERTDQKIERNGEGKQRAKKKKKKKGKQKRI